MLKDFKCFLCSSKRLRYIKGTSHHGKFFKLLFYNELNIYKIISYNIYYNDSKIYANILDQH